MSIEALILGKLHQRAEQRTSKTGRPFVTAKARTAAGEGESLFVNVIAFGETACAALLALDAGDSLEAAIEHVLADVTSRATFCHGCGYPIDGGGILAADVDVDLLRADGVRADQRTFQDAAGVAFQ